MGSINLYTHWIKAKENFEKATDEKKPTKTFLKIRTTAGIAKVFEKYEEAILERGLSPKKKLKITQKMAGKANKEIKSYIKLLDKQLANEKKTQEYKDEIDILKTELEYLQEMIKSLLVQDQKGTENWDIVVFIIRNHENTMRTAIKKFLVAAKKVKSSPTVETWNTIMAVSDPPFRAITTAMDGFKIVVKRLDKIPEEYNDSKSEFYNVLYKMKKFSELAEKTVKDTAVQAYSAQAQKVALVKNDYSSKEEETKAVLLELTKVRDCAKLFHDKIFKPFDIYEDGLQD